MDEFDDELPDTWATRTVAAIDLSRTISTLLLIGAAVALVAGLVSAVASYAGADAFGGVGEEGFTAMISVERRMYLSQSLQMFILSLLPAGLLAAAAAALRLQAARTEALPVQD